MSRPSSPEKAAPRAQTESLLGQAEIGSCRKINQRKPTGKGGRRPGAGRPKGSKTSRIRMASQKAIHLAAQGESPLEYMLRVLRQTDDDLETKLRKGELDQLDFTRLKSERDRRRDWAAQSAAPYVHPKLAAVEMKVDDSRTEKDVEAEMIDALTDEELDALEAMLIQAKERKEHQSGRAH